MALPLQTVLKWGRGIPYSLLNHVGVCRDSLCLYGASYGTVQQSRLKNFIFSYLNLKGNTNQMLQLHRKTSLFSAR